MYSQRQIVVKATCLCVSGLQYNAALYIQYNVRRTAGYIHSYMKFFLAFSLNHENETNFSSIVLLSCQSTLVCCVYCIYRPFGILFITYVCLCTYYSTCHWLAADDMYVTYAQLPIYRPKCSPLSRETLWTVFDLFSVFLETGFIQSSALSCFTIFF